MMSGVYHPDDSGLDVSRLCDEAGSIFYSVHTWEHVQLLASMPTLDGSGPPHSDVLIEPSLHPLTGQSTVQRDGAVFRLEEDDRTYVSHFQIAHPLYVRIARPGKPVVAVDLVVTTWLIQQEMRAQLGRRAPGRRAKASGTRALQDWIAATRALAQDTQALVDIATRSAMTEAAGLAELNIGWWQRHFVAPAVDARRLHEQRLSLLAWVVDQLVAACNSFQPYPHRQTVDRGTVLRSLLCKTREQDQQFEAAAWQRRVKRLQRSIRPGHHDVVMGGMLENLHQTTP